MSSVLQTGDYSERLSAAAAAGGGGEEGREKEVRWDRQVQRRQ